jgi:hypothetical protein
MSSTVTDIVIPEGWTDVTNNPEFTFLDALVKERYLRDTVLPLIREPVNINGRETKSILKIELAQGLAKMCIRNYICKDVCKIIDSYMSTVSMVKRGCDSIYNGRTLQVIRMLSNMERDEWVYKFDFTTNFDTPSKALSFTTRATTPFFNVFGLHPNNIFIPGMEPKVGSLAPKWHQGKFRRNLVRFTVPEFIDKNVYVDMEQGYYDFLLKEFEEMQDIFLFTWSSR